MQKYYILYFFFFYYQKIIKVIYAFFAIVIKDLNKCFSRTNLLLVKSITSFELLAQKKEISK